MTRDAVLLMTYGSPRNLDEVADYYTEIRGGRRPQEAAIAELRARYARVGGSTPLAALTARLAQGVQEQLGDAYRVHWGCRHWHPFVAAAVAALVAQGASRLVAIPLAPHYSTFGTEGYRRAVLDALAGAGGGPELDFVERWAGLPGFERLIAERIRSALAGAGSAFGEGAHLLFTAHSLPRRILEHADPYPDELRASAAAIAARVGGHPWDLAYQSAGRTAEPWLGPDLAAALRRLAGQGCRHVLAIPFGFVCDHLEVLHDVDVQAARAAGDLGMELRRIRMPNADPAFAALLAGLVRSRTAAAARGRSPGAHSSVAEG